MIVLNTLRAYTISRDFLVQYRLQSHTVYMYTYYCIHVYILLAHVQMLCYLLT